jgi:hypothetical protein
MTSRIILIVSICIISCENDTNKSYDIVISGKITDQVTTQVIEGATVSCGIIPGLMRGEGLLGVKDSTFSDSNGFYKLITQSQSGAGASLTMKTQSIAVLATKVGYSTSNRNEIYYLDAHNTSMNFELFHYCQLNLHIKNDTINNSIDAVDITLDRIIQVGSLQEAYFTCNSRKLDSVYEIKKIPGNLTYYIQVLKPGGAQFSQAISYSVNLKPDVINYFDITF